MSDEKKKKLVRELTRIPEHGEGYSYAGPVADWILGFMERIRDLENTITFQRKANDILVMRVSKLENRADDDGGITKLSIAEIDALKKILGT